MSDKIAEIEKRNRERTQGEWEVVRSRDVFSAVVLPGVAVIGSDFERDEDAEFVANAPRDITNLLAEVERLKGELKHCRQLLRDGQPPSEFSGMDTMKWSHYRRKQVEMLDQPNPEEVR